jgi:hypothetical protein
MSNNERNFPENGNDFAIFAPEAFFSSNAQKRTCQNADNGVK